jgi:type IV pilus assembly protein PilE
VREERKDGARGRGFTLIELLIVVAIMSLIAAVAIPSYQKQVQKNARAVAKARLSQAAQLLERFYSDNSSYYVDVSGGNLVVGTSATAAGFAKLMNVTGTTIYSGSNNETNSPYQITVCSASTCTLAGPNVFTLTATPTGNQATGDAGCGNLTLTNAGVKGVSGASGVAACW